MQEQVVDTTDAGEPSPFPRNELLAFVRAVANIIAADKVVTEDERAYLAMLVRQTGLSLLDEDVQAAINDEIAAPSPIEVVARPISDPQLRRTLYQTLVEVAYADGSLAAEEEERLVALSKTFGLNPEAARDLIDWTGEHIRLERRGEEIIARL
jgi:uncharacterized tellurite resistance protein B-like protein